VNSISERARKKGLDFSVEVDESLPSVLMGDDVRISQIIMNLLTNAVKYTRKGEVVLLIRNSGIADNTLRLFVSVKDTGIGIRKEDIDKLSISFERLDEKKNRHIEGTGLGISIVTRLLAMMKSELKIKSEYGVGSEFYFELPIEIVNQKPIGKYDVNINEAIGEIEEEIRLHAPKARILLTDDNEMNRKVAANLMRLFGIKPVLCESGEETIAEMKWKDYDILLLDHMMPEMDGIETLKVLKERGLVKQTKIIALTANAVVGAKEQYLKAGFDDYLSKPVQLDDLERVFRKYLPDDIIEEEKVTETEKTEVSDVEKKEVSDTSESSLIDNMDNNGTAGPLDKLKGIGINVEDGLCFCGDSEDFYLEILSDYAKEVPEKKEKLGEFLKSGNMKDYKILIHSVKSSSKTIGATSMFEKALDLEEAAADGKIDYVSEHHDIVMEEMTKLANEIVNII
jgi:Signal transduction histidine kinase